MHTPTSIYSHVYSLHRSRKLKFRYTQGLQHSRRHLQTGHRFTFLQATYIRELICARGCTHAHTYTQRSTQFLRTLIQLHPNSRKQNTHAQYVQKQFSHACEHASMHVFQKYSTIKCTHERNRADFTLTENRDACVRVNA